MSLDEKFWETTFTIHVPENETQKTIATENTSKSTSGNFCISSLAKERGAFYVLFWPQFGIEYIVHIFGCSKSFNPKRGYHHDKR